MNLNQSRILILLSSLVFFAGCAPSIKRVDFLNDNSNYNPQCAVKVEKSSDFPEPIGTSVGKIKIGDTGFSTNCAYPDVIAILKSEACKQNANYVYITKVKKPSFWGSTCYRVEAELYKVAPENLTESQVVEREETVSEETKGSNPVLNILAFTVSFIAGFALVTFLLN